MLMRKTLHGSFLQEMLLNLRIIDRPKSNNLDFVMFMIDGSDDDCHELFFRNTVIMVPETSVHMEILSEIGESPLPRVNPRFGHPTPQQGVEVERKWKRPDYRTPGSQVVQIQQK